MACHDLSNDLINSVAVVFLLVSLNLQQVNADAVGWSYKFGNVGGPENWHITYQNCGGAMQSPIDIDSNRVLYDPLLEHFDFSDYEITDDVEMELENVGGHTAEVLFSGRDLFLKGGGLPDKYKLEQFHFHWGQNNRRGSEHALDGEHFPMEVHFVHRQQGLLNSSNAAEHPFGLAVMGFFFRIGKKNSKYEQLLDHFENITNANQRVHIPTFPVIQLLPPSKRYDFFRYQGSLTTPPCYESVIWSVATDFIEISEDQLDKFRGLFDAEHHQLVDDFRPIQRINHRTVLTTRSSYREKDNNGCGSLTPQQITMLVMALIYFYIF